MSNFLHWLKSPIGIASIGIGLVIVAFIFIERSKANSQQAAALDTGLAAAPPIDNSNGTQPASAPGGPPDNDGADLPPGTLPAAPAPGSNPSQQPVMYTTKAGDTLSSIQYIYHLWGDDTIKKNNPIVSGYGLFDKLPAGLTLLVGYK